jgi:hypothetical protein
VGCSAGDLRRMHPQSTLALDEYISHEREAMVPTVPASIGTVLLDADACGPVSLSPPSLMQMSMSEIAIFRQLTDFDTMSERNLDAKGRTFYSLPRKHAIRPWNRRNVGNCARSGVHLQQNRAKHAKQGLSVYLSVRILRAIEFRLQLRQRLGLWVSQNELDWCDHYRRALRSLRNFCAAAIAPPKPSMTPFTRMSGANTNDAF